MEEHCNIMLWWQVKLYFYKWLSARKEVEVIMEVEEPLNLLAWQLFERDTCKKDFGLNHL